ncbi:ankyrin repeat domain-containing protein [Burkholderia sp. WSM2232]|uniref:ankyrin repeat domain-containing protein n=1 Tax=Burkholderia sp. WSM2232 TaxID=944436 RepID=UPI00040046B9|nr:ankyrin repeat domain-containing protein [Burkholderia sp. WSM2232]
MNHAGALLLHYAAATRVTAEQAGALLGALERALEDATQASFETQDAEGNTPLHVAALHQCSREVFQLLVHKAASLNARFSILNHDGFAVIHLVCSMEMALHAYRSNFVAAMLENVPDLDVDQLSADRRTALDMALDVSLEALEVVLGLLRAGADPNGAGRAGEMSLARVSAWQEIYEQALLREPNGGLLEDQWFLALLGRHSFMLLDPRSALATLRESGAKRTPASRALDIIGALDRSLTINQALRKAVDAGDGEQARMLTLRGARLPVCLDARRASTDLADYFVMLINNRFWLSASLIDDPTLSAWTDADGRTIVFYLAHESTSASAVRDRLSSMDLLFALGTIDLNIADTMGDTPLHYIARLVSDADAAIFGELLRRATNAGFDFSTRNGNGLTVLQILVGRSDFELVHRYLETVGRAAINEPSVAGYSALDMALENDPFQNVMVEEGGVLAFGRSFIGDRRIVGALLANGAQRAHAMRGNALGMTAGDEAERSVSDSAGRAAEPLSTVRSWWYSLMRWVSGTGSVTSGP